MVGGHKLRSWLAVFKHASGELNIKVTHLTAKSLSELTGITCEMRYS